MGFIAPRVAEAQRVRVERRDGVRRTEIVIRAGYPIRRRQPTVIVHRSAFVVRVAPVRFEPLVVWRPIVVVAPPVGERLAWQDAETLSRDDDWAETNFDSNQRGDKLFLQVVSGRVQFDFAEVVFANGDTRVVDFNNATQGPGLYDLLDFRDGRTVDHVRLVARAKSREARVALLMQK
jgi:hypothetical protein